MSIVVEVYTL